MPTPSPHPPPGVRTQVTCSKCGAATSVPFAPTPGRPVFCRECFAKEAPRGPAVRAHDHSRPFHAKPAQNQRQRMMAQGRKSHFMHDARAVMGKLEGGMEDQHVRAFLEGVFARGARQSTAEAQVFLDSKLADQTITEPQRMELGRLVERYSF